MHYMKGMTDYIDPIPEEGQDPGEGGSYKCPYCDWSCGWIGVLEHMKSEHKVELK